MKMQDFAEWLLLFEVDSLANNSGSFRRPLVPPYTVPIAPVCSTLRREGYEVEGCGMVEHRQKKYWSDVGGGGGVCSVQRIGAASLRRTSAVDAGTVRFRDRDC